MFRRRQETADLPNRWLPAAVPSSPILARLAVLDSSGSLCSRLIVVSLLCVRLSLHVKGKGRERRASWLRSQTLAHDEDDERKKKCKKKSSLPLQASRIPRPSLSTSSSTRTS